MKETQLLKGILEGCVLDMIGQKERYGYELVQTLREAGFDTIVKEGEERVSVFWQQWDDLSQKVEGIKNGG